MLVGMCLLAFPSLLGIFAMAHVYITSVSGWLTAESNTLAILSAFTLGFDLYYTSQWDTSFFWHKTHVFAHFVFLISEYAALGYLQGWNKIIIFCSLCFLISQLQHCIQIQIYHSKYITINCRLLRIPLWSPFRHNPTFPSSASSWLWASAWRSSSSFPTSHST